MARKKKKPASGNRKASRKRKKKETGKAAAAELATPAAPNTPEADAPGPAPPAVEPAPDEPPLTDADSGEPAGVDLDGGEPPVADLDGREPPVADQDAGQRPFTDLDAGEPVIVDLDEGGEADDLVAALIAETVATAPPPDEPDEPEPPLIDLDADVEAERAVEEAAADVSDAVAESAAAQPAPGRAERTAEEAIRLLADLGSVSSPAIRDRLLAEALAHAEHKDASYRVPFADAPTAGRWKALAAFVVLLLAALVALAPPGWARPDTPPQLATSERAHGLRLALLLQAEQIEAFRVREQRLPETLADVGEALPGLRYVLSGTRAYQLIAYLPDGTAVVYDSARPMPGFEAVEPAWRPEEGSP